MSSGFGFDEVAELIDKSEAACRQLAVRAREKVQDGKPRFETSVEKRWALAETFFAAIEQGDTEGLADMLAEDVVLYGDGGGKAPARREPLRGMSETARFLAAFSPRADREGWTLTLVDVNGQPGALVNSGDGATVAVVSLDVAMGKVQAVRAVVNPDKLGHLAGPGH